LGFRQQQQEKSAEGTTQQSGEGTQVISGRRYTKMNRCRLVLLCRKRIRLFCDELNALVPFCDASTDRVTTLHWTTAFLRFISKMFGDALKKVQHSRTRRDRLPSPARLQARSRDNKEKDETLIIDLE
uniref:BHLH domain-containing protein n=1 Tax=Scophthalmus maximus TaxID=52904 RepID=A0A8D2ZD80_SCOMX